MVIEYTVRLELSSEAGYSYTTRSISGFRIDRNIEDLHESCDLYFGWGLQMEAFQQLRGSKDKEAKLFVGWRTNSSEAFVEECVFAGKVVYTTKKDNYMCLHVCDALYETMDTGMKNENSVLSYGRDTRVADILAEIDKNCVEKYEVVEDTQLLSEVRFESKTVYGALEELREKAGVLVVSQCKRDGSGTEVRIVDELRLPEDKVVRTFDYGYMREGRKIEEIVTDDSGLWWNGGTKKAGVVVLSTDKQNRCSRATLIDEGFVGSPSVYRRYRERDEWDLQGLAEYYHYLAKQKGLVGKFTTLGCTPFLRRLDVIALEQEGRGMGHYVVNRNVITLNENGLHQTITIGLRLDSTEMLSADDE